MKRYLTLIILVFFALSSRAVLKEENLNRTVKMLRMELETFQRNERKDFKKFEAQRQKYWQKLNANMAKTEELSLVLYSQKDNYMFGLAHGCRQVREMYLEFDGDKYPFTEWKDNYDSEILRYKKLHETLMSITPQLLNDEGRADLKRSLKICDSITKVLVQRENMLHNDDAHYNKIAKKMRGLEKYTEDKYAAVRYIIFVRGSESYFSLLSNFPDRWDEFVASVHEVYFTGQNASKEWHMRTLQLIGSSIFIFLLAFGMSYLIFYKILPYFKKLTYFNEKRRYWTMCLSLSLTTLFLFIVSLTILNRNFFIIATTLSIEYIWLIITILLSITIRVSKKDINNTLILYAPAMWVGLLLILMRVMMISNEMARMVCLRSCWSLCSSTWYYSSNTAGTPLEPTCSTVGCSSWSSLPGPVTPSCPCRLPCCG